MEKIIKGYKIPKIDTQVANSRGQIIHLMILLETEIEECIALYFCGKSKVKRKEFIHSVLCKESFNSNTKYGLLSFIIKQSFPDFLNTHPSYIQDIEELNIFRNHCAHRKFHGSMQNDAENLFFEYYKTERNKIRVEKIAASNKVFYQKAKKVLDVHSITVLLFNEISKYIKDQENTKLSGSPAEMVFPGLLMMGGYKK